MPHIDPKKRPHIDIPLKKVYPQLVDSGDANYAVTRILQSQLPKNPRYEDYNRVMGIAVCALLEFYRKAVVPYEDQKAHDNGDVYAISAD